MTPLKLLLKLFKELFLIPVKTILSLGILIGLPSLVLLLVPIYLCRMIISRLRFLGPDLGEIISVRSSVFISEDWKSPKYCCTLCATGKGTVDIDNIRTIFFDKVMTAKNEKGQLKNILLKQYPYRWMGYYFWKWEKDFNICDHIYEWIPEETSDQNNTIPTYTDIEINEMAQKFSGMHYTDGRSPWEVKILRYMDSEIREEKLAVFFRANHSFGDAYALMKLLFKDFDEKGTFLEEIDKILYKLTPNWWQRILLFIDVVIRGPWYCATNLLNALKWPKWKIIEPKLKSNTLYSISGQIPMEQLKNAAASHKVGVSAVIYSCYAAALRKAYEKNSGKIPHTMYCPITLPMIGHPDRLDTHATIIILPLPLEESDPVKRVKKIERNVMWIKTSSFPIVIFYLLPIVCGLFPFVLHKLIKLGCALKEVPVATVSIPGPKSKFDILGVEASSAYFLVEISDVIPVVLITLSMNGFMQYSLMGNNGVFANQEDLDEMFLTMQTELDILNKSSV